MSPDIPASAKRQYFKIPEGFENFDDSQIEEFSSHIYDEFMKSGEHKGKAIELDTGPAESSKNEATSMGD